MELFGKRDLFSVFEEGEGEADSERDLSKKRKSDLLNDDASQVRFQTVGIKFSLNRISSPNLGGTNKM
jgi:hypothetical protein